MTMDDTQRKKYRNIALGGLAGILVIGGIITATTGGGGDDKAACTSVGEALRDTLHSVEDYQNDRTPDTISAASEAWAGLGSAADAAKWSTPEVESVVRAARGTVTAAKADSGSFLDGKGLVALQQSWQTTCAPLIA